MSPGDGYFLTIIITDRNIEDMDSEADDAQFDWLTLDDDEEVLWADTAHRLSLVPSLVPIIPLCLILLGIPLLIWTYLGYTNTQFVVTNTALYKKTGIFSRNVRRIEFDKLQNTSYQQSALASYFGYGTVNISTAGSSGVEMSFRNVAEPRDVQTLINKRSKKQQRSTSNENGKAAVLDEILEELQTIRRTVEVNEETTSDTADDKP